jgi:GNAT acetyltransferase-like protein
VEVRPENADGSVLVAEEHGQTLGSVESELSGGTRVVRRLDVYDEERHEEIAQALLTTLVAEEADRVTVEVAESDERAASLYARLGFVPVRRVLGVNQEVLRNALERTHRGESFGSVHVQTDDLPAVQRAVAGFVPLTAGGSAGSVVVPPRGGWISVYDDLADRDPTALRRLARELSDRLGAVVLSLGVEEGAVVRYLLLDRGRLLDEYLSVQEYYGPLPSGEVVALAANPTLVERLTGGERRRVRAAAVHAKRPEDLPPPAETAAALAEAMRIEGGGHGYRTALELPAAIRIDRG